MSPLRSLFQPRWQHKNPQIRKKTISQLTDPDLLLKIVHSDPQPDLKSLALAQIEDPDTLDNLIDKPGDLGADLLGQALGQRLKQLLPKPEAINNINQVDILTRIATLSDDQEIVASAIGRISDQNRRLEIALSHASAKVRMLAAEGIDESPLLRQLAEASRGKDKTIYRYCKSRLDQRDTEQKYRQQQQNTISHLIDAARQLSLNEDAADYRSRYLGLEQQWQALGAIVSKNQQQQFQGHMTTCAEHLASLAKAQAMEQQRRQEIRAAEKTFSSLIRELEQLDSPDAQPVTESDAGALTSLLDDIDRRWQNASGTTSPTSAQLQDYKTLSKHWRAAVASLKQLSKSRGDVEKWLSKAQSVDSKDFVRLQALEKSAVGLLEKMPWPATHTRRQPDPLRRLSQQREQLKQAIEQLHSQQKKHLDQLSSQIDKLQQALAANNSKAAESAYHRARQSLKALDPKQHGKAEDRLHTLGARLQEIKDWKGFALEPKKLALCQHMETLCDSRLEPDTLAAEIQSLQSRWKQLGSLPDKRQEQNLWEQFKAASDRAWEPCAEAFAQQAQVRKANYRARMDLVAQLQSYEQSIAWPDSPTSAGTASLEAIEGASDQEAINQQDKQPLTAETSASENTENTENTKVSKAKPDWQLVQQTLDTARAAFTGLSPVNKADEQKSRRALRKICDRIYSHIKAEYQRNIEAKEKLIEQASSLIAEAELDHAIEQAKQLQGQWKTIGLTPKSADRRLWQAFRGACDAIFKRLEEQKNQRRSEIDGKIQEAENLLALAQKLVADYEGKQAAQLLADLRQKISDFNEIELPEKLQSRLRQQFSELEKSAEQAIASFRDNQDKARWRCLVNKIQACALQPTDQAKALELWHRHDELPAGIDSQALENYWQQGSATASEDAYREACISLEIAADLESRAEDKQIRMELQMQRLVKSSGNKLAEGQPSAIDITNQFIALRPSAEWAQRFCQNLASLKPAG